MANAIPQKTGVSSSQAFSGRDTDEASRSRAADARTLSGHAASAPLTNATIFCSLARRTERQPCSFSLGDSPSRHVWPVRRDMRANKKTMNARKTGHHGLVFHWSKVSEAFRVFRYSGLSQKGALVPGTFIIKPKDAPPNRGSRRGPTHSNLRYKFIVAGGGEKVHLRFWSTPPTSVSAPMSSPTVFYNRIKTIVKEQ